ncbi:unnamed protein product [Rotaria magnacalcarata]|uniref:TIR domain-containing protein n=1 Tax=Rotaria magnacalcarata TaxID=392030 RepID=A0A816XW09_9BILA|nr:unnamed protein product [Rotaria magnacalcarata]CAF1616546.1 unnamed protein product [Rotaria magnacalcarata]CAF2150470.1 unnamed protein product [Rotaria magnacalcarata]CAF4002226.1 unnamed protein product [Rotaria magnacalcarata]CAF4023782.1 unnamed protein product [Rotaria magnacalcarata]
MSDTNKRLIELLDIKNLPSVDILDQTKETVQQIGNDILDKLNDFVLTCLQLPIDKILLILRKRTDNIFLTIENFAWIIWGKFNLQNEINEQELEFLKNTQQLNRTMVDLDIDEHDGKFRNCWCMIECVIAPLMLEKNFMEIFESIIKKLTSDSFCHQHELSIVSVISQWLDTISHIHYFLRTKKRMNGKHKQHPLTQIITEIIMKPIYKQYVEKHCSSNVEMKSIEQFYISSCSFYYAFISDLKNWLDIVEPLLYYSRKFVIFHVQSIIEQWSPNILHCMKSFISLITQYYEYIYAYCPTINKPSAWKTNIYFDNDADYMKSIIVILNNKSIQDKLLITWSNDETIIIDMIITYFLRLVTCTEQAKCEILHLLRTTKSVGTIYSLISRNDLYESLKSRIFSLLSILLNDTIISQLNISEQIAFVYCTRIEMTLTRLKPKEDDFERDNMETYLSDFRNVLKNDLIQQEIIKLNKLDIFINLEDKFHSVEKYEIIWTLSFHPSVKLLMKNTPFLSSLRSECQSRNHRNEFYIEQAVWGILWNLGDHQGLTRLRKKYNGEHCYGERVENCIPITNFDAMINYYDNDLEQVDTIVKKLRGCGVRPLLNELSGKRHGLTRNVMIDTMEAIGNIKHFIICLSENCARSNFCRAILTYAHKKRLIIIPVIVQYKYTIAHDWLYFILGSLSILDFEDKEMMIQLVRRIKHHDINAVVECNQQLPLSLDDSITDDSLHDLYNDCKNNEFDKIKSYISSMTIKQINKQQPNGSTALHVAAYYGYCEIVKLLFAHGAWRSIRNTFNLTAYEEARTEKIRQLFQRKHDNYYFIRDINDGNVLEWTIMYDEIQTQRTLFREQFLGNTNSSLDDKRVLDSFQKYYLQKTSLEPKLRSSLDLYFTMAAEENDLRYVLSAYTSATIFHKILNKDLATYALHYFDSTLNKTQDYTFSTCIIDLIALLIHSNGLESYYCQNTVTSYRGMLITRDELKKYNVGAQIMNVSFLSTSKNKAIAQIFAGEGAMDYLRQTPDHTPIHLSTLCIYHTKNHRTALQIAGVSEVPDEEEILILPFSAYEIVSVRKYDGNKNNGVIMEIELEECAETS